MTDFPKLTLERLRQVLHYDPGTGEFRNRVTRCATAQAGAVAGSVSPSGYRLVMIDRVHYLAGRLAWFYMTGRWPLQVDHIDHDRSNDAWANLRDVSPRENGRNHSRRSDNKSGVTGVYWCKDTSRWHAQIRVNYRQKSLGRFDSIDEARHARRRAELLYGFHRNHGSSR